MHEWTILLFRRVLNTRDVTQAPLQHITMISSSETTGNRGTGDQRSSSVEARILIILHWTPTNERFSFTKSHVPEAC